MRCCDFENVGHGSHSLPQAELSSKRGDETFRTLAPPTHLAARSRRSDHGDRARRRARSRALDDPGRRSPPTRDRRSSPTRTSTTSHRADRAKIDALLDKFIPAAVERRSAKTAWALSGPELHAYSSVAQWRAGNSPVPQYPARGTKFHYWTVVYVGKNEVLFNILLHPRPKVIIPTYEFSGQVIRHGTGLARQPPVHDRDVQPPKRQDRTGGRAQRLQRPGKQPEPGDEQGASLPLVRDSRCSSSSAGPFSSRSASVPVALMRGRRFRRAAARSLGLAPPRLIRRI